MMDLLQLAVNAGLVRDRLPWNSFLACFLKAGMKLRHTRVSTDQSPRFFYVFVASTVVLMWKRFIRANAIDSRSCHNDSLIIVRIIPAKGSMWRRYITIFYPRFNRSHRIADTCRVSQVNVVAFVV